MWSVLVNGMYFAKYVINYLNNKINIFPLFERNSVIDSRGICNGEWESSEVE